jgi:hypothetical protein
MDLTNFVESRYVILLLLYNTDQREQITPFLKHKDQRSTKRSWQNKDGLLLLHGITI